MDILPDWAAHFLSDHETLCTYIPYLRQSYTYLTLVKSYTNTLLNSISRNPDLATIALFLVIVLASLMILNMLWQMVVFWVRLAGRVVFWGGLIALAVWMYSRGPEGVVEDVGFWWEVWQRDYGYWKERERMAMMGRQGRGMGGGGTGWF